jgi:hypothetical protein
MPLSFAKRWGRRSPALRAAWGRLRWWTSEAGRRQASLSVRYMGFGRKCPYCGWQGRAFHPTAEHARPDAQCPRCYAKERHRALYFYLEEVRGQLGSDSRVLEIAPEPHSLCYWRRHRRETTFVSLDLFSPLADVRADVLRIPAADQTFDLIVCLHVLEHVADDRAAMRELRRVLRPASRLVVQVPLDRPLTFEDPKVVDPRERERLFGQDDHVRAYGWDIVDRLSAAELSVSVEDITRSLSPDQARRAGVVRGETVLVCTRA